MIIFWMHPALLLLLGIMLAALELASSKMIQHILLTDR